MIGWLSVVLSYKISNSLKSPFSEWVDKLSSSQGRHGCCFFNFASYDIRRQHWLVNIIKKELVPGQQPFPTHQWSCFCNPIRTSQLFQYPLTSSSHKPNSSTRYCSNYLTIIISGSSHGPVMNYMHKSNLVIISRICLGERVYELISDSKFSGWKGRSTPRELSCSVDSKIQKWT